MRFSSSYFPWSVGPRTQSASIAAIAGNRGGPSDPPFHRSMVRAILQIQLIPKVMPTRSHGRRRGSPGYLASPGRGWANGSNCCWYNRQKGTSVTSGQPRLVTLLAFLGFQADRYLDHSPVYRINFKHSLAGIERAVQPVFVNAIPLHNVGIVRSAVFGLHIRRRIAAVCQRKHEIGVRVLLVLHRRQLREWERLAGQRVIHDRFFVLAENSFPNNVANPLAYFLVQRRTVHLARPLARLALRPQLVHHIGAKYAGVLQHRPDALLSRQSGRSKKIGN